MTDSTDRLDHWLDTLGVRAGGDDKPRVGVSACLLGRPVRYDGQHKRDNLVSRVLPRWLNMHELCPETAIGLPTPRPPIEVVQLADQQRVRGVASPQDDYTAALRTYAQQYAQQMDSTLSGFILKARSPSCGLGNTPLTDTEHREIGLTDGAFAGQLRARLPLMPMLNESHLQTGTAIEGFVLQVFCFRMWQRWGTGEWLERARQHAGEMPESLGDPVLAHLRRLDEATCRPHI